MLCQNYSSLLTPKSTYFTFGIVMAGVDYQRDMIANHPGDNLLSMSARECLDWVS